MPRKKPETTEKPKLTDYLLRHMQKKFGEDSISTSGGYGDITGYLDTGILALNYAIGHDGIPKGRITSLQGAEQAGKTSTITTILAACQKRGGLTVYVDAEYKFDRAYAARLGLYDVTTLPDAIERGLASSDTLPLMIIYPEHIQRVFQQFEELIAELREQDPDVEVLMAWDSVAATPSTVEFEANYDSAKPGSPAAQMSQGLKKLAFTLARNNVTLLIVNQEKEAIDMMGRGGSKVAVIAQRPIAFHSTVRIEVKKVGFLTRSSKDKEEDGIGIKVAAKIAKNQCGPYGRIARYELVTVGRSIGVDNDAWILDYALDGVKPGIVVRAGAYFNLRGSTNKFYRRDFSGSPDYAEIKSRVQDAMEMELADRFGQWTPNSRAEASEDGEDDDLGEPVVGLSDAELEEWENEQDD